MLGISGCKSSLLTCTAVTCPAAVSAECRMRNAGMLERAQRYMPSASPTPGYAAADANGHYPRTPASARRSSLGLADGGDGGESEMDKRQRELYSKQQHLLREQRSADQERLLSCISGTSPSPLYKDQALRVPS